MNPTIALFQHHPECSIDCCNGIIVSLNSKYNIKIFSESDICPALFDGIDIVAFPGGIGDSDSYDRFFRRRAENAVADFVANGGRYLGICMGAYWAGSNYFDILDSVEPVQYIKQPTADIQRSYGTVAPIVWEGRNEEMFFYDGCALIGNESKFKTVARYANNDPMAIIQNKIGLIGCHPESLDYWYSGKYNYIKEKWHGGRHHAILLNFVNQLMLS